MTFAERLRELREQAGMTQERLADQSGINIWTLRGYEQGRREPNWKGAIALARALGVAVEAFADCVSVDDAGSAESGTAPPARQRGRPAKAPAVEQETRLADKTEQEPPAEKKVRKGQGRKRKDG